MSENQEKYIFGPVLSRRLGLSLGIDLIPYKTCSFNCVYCECGKTTNLTLKRSIFVPTLEVISELETFFATKTPFEYLTFSGSGEPTLAKNIGEIITWLKQKYSEFKIAVLTNGSLLADSEVRNDLKQADLVFPTFNGVSEEVIRKINRPCLAWDQSRNLLGLIQFRKEFKQKIVLEIFIVPGINDTKKELSLIKLALEQIQPDGIQLNSLDRPGTEKKLRKATYDELDQIAKFFEPFKTEIIIRNEAKIQPLLPNKQKSGKSGYGKILAVLKRRPCTSLDLVKSLQIPIEEVEKYLKILRQENLIDSKKENQYLFYYLK